VNLKWLPARQKSTNHGDPVSVPLLAEMVAMPGPPEYEGSIPLQEWARKNKDQKYVPSNLLQAWGLDVKADP
jgi:hypothetical protein